MFIKVPKCVESYKRRSIKRPIIWLGISDWSIFDRIDFRLVNSKCILCVCVEIFYIWNVRVVVANQCSSCPIRLFQYLSIRLSLVDIQMCLHLKIHIQQANNVHWWKLLHSIELFTLLRWILQVRGIFRLLSISAWTRKLPKHSNATYIFIEIGRV